MSTQTCSGCLGFPRRFRLAPADASDEIKSIFRRYSENGYISMDNLRRFFFEIQKYDATSEYAQAIVESLGRHHRGLRLEDFLKYLFDDNNHPIRPNLGVHQDMTAPLCHYFIYTGHNSYLTGDQLSSDCSDVPIIQALHKGVRVI